MRKYIEDTYNVTVDLDTTEGSAYIYGQDGRSVAAAAKLVQDIAVLIKEGDTVTATVQSVMDFGALVTINRAQQALLHISDLTYDPAILRNTAFDVLQVGQRYHVKVLN